MAVEEHKGFAPPPVTLRVAVVTASDSRTPENNEGGRLLATLSSDAGFAVAHDIILRENPAQIRDHLRLLIDGSKAGKLDGVLITGGTGIADRDATVEALAGLLEKRLDGYGELFRMLSFAEIGPAAMLSRAIGRHRRARRAVRHAGLARGRAPGDGAADPARARPRGGVAPGAAPGAPRTAATTMDIHDALASPAGRRCLTDPQGRRIDYLRISVTDRCNYRCTYCMPDDGIDHVDRADILSFEEIVAIVGCFAALGVRRLRLTGGEPTVRRDLVDLARRLRAVPGIEDLALSTNGHLLAELAAPLRAAGVSRLNVSLDTLDPRSSRASPGAATSRACWPASTPRAPPASRRSRSTPSPSRASTTARSARSARTPGRAGLVPRFIEQMPMAGGEMFVPGELLSAQEIRDLVLGAHPGAALSPTTAARRAAPGRRATGASRRRGAAARRHGSASSRR